jgi:hypothetical protein
MNRDSILTDPPREMDNEKLFNNSHEVNLTAFTEEMAEKSFHLRALREVSKIVNVEPQRERGQRRGCCGIGRINNTTGEKAWVLQRRAKTNWLEDFVDFVIPKMRATTETIECVLKEPVFIVVSVKIPSWGADDCNFLRRQNTLTEGILAIALTKRAPFLDGKADQEAEWIAREDRSKLVQLRPDLAFMIPKHDDARLST